MIPPNKDPLLVIANNPSLIVFLATKKTESSFNLALKICSHEINS